MFSSVHNGYEMADYNVKYISPSTYLQLGNNHLKFQTMQAEQLTTLGENQKKNNFLIFAKAIKPWKHHSIH